MHTVIACDDLSNATVPEAPADLAQFVGEFEELLAGFAPDPLDTDGERMRDWLPRLRELAGLPASGPAPVEPPAAHPGYPLWAVRWVDGPDAGRPLDVLKGHRRPGGAYLGDGWKAAIRCRLAALQLAEALERLQSAAGDFAVGREELTLCHLADMCLGPAWALRQFATAVDGVVPVDPDPAEEPAAHPWFAALPQLIPDDGELDALDVR